MRERPANTTHNTTPTPVRVRSERESEMKNTGKSLRSGGKYGQEARKDRKSTTGVNGSPKKGGHGGKFTWSGDGNFSSAELGGFDRAVTDDVIDPKSDDLE
ncbi:hypothetical protein L2E82_39352 [Cichorium intybus]|uniref:Uncharacterized protein n=1 Tax=Cichorium intybus TaxID=13427 RepID=A0ACB9AJA3_CICIN|nr:hypothetical protein L2E82_39352 [Cichorium intybus]